MARKQLGMADLISRSSYVGTDLVKMGPIAAPQKRFAVKVRALAVRNAETEVPLINEYIHELYEVRSALLGQSQSFLSSAKVSTNDYVRDIAIEHAHDVLEDVARIDEKIRHLTAPANAEGGKL